VPIYEYRCPACGAEFDRIQKVSDPNPACEACGAPEVTRKVSLSSFQLKGTGWYATDYAPKAQPSGGPDVGKENSTPSSSDAKAAKEVTTTKDAAPAKGTAAPSPKST